VSSNEELWIPLVDEPIGGIVARVEEEDPEIHRLVAAPERLLAFRTFAYIRVGVLLGQLLADNDVEADDGSATWVDALMRDPAHRSRVRAEVRAVAEEIAAEASPSSESSEADDEVRARFRDFAKRLMT
jgi:hypothetical protein